MQLRFITFAAGRPVWFVRRMKPHFLSGRILMIFPVPTSERAGAFVWFFNGPPAGDGDRSSWLLWANEHFFVRSSTNLVLFNPSCSLSTA